MGERFTYAWLAAILILTVACGSGQRDEAPEEFTASGTGQATLPGAPEIVRVTPGDGYATVDWHAPAAAPETGESIISRYVVTGIPDGSRSVDGDVLTVRVGGLTNGQAYTFTVRAVNEAGFGPDSGSSKPVLVAAPPGPPPAVAAMELSLGGVRLAWLAPSRDGGNEIVTYVVTSENDGTTLVLEGDPAAGYVAVGDEALETRPGLADGSSMVFVIDLGDALSEDRFRVAAGNVRGLGQWSPWASPVKSTPPEPDDGASDISDPGDSGAPEAPSTPSQSPESSSVSSVSALEPNATPQPIPEQETVAVFASPTPSPPPPPTATPPPPSTPDAGIMVRWLPTLYGEGGPPSDWRPSLLGGAGTPFLLHSIEAWSSDPVDVFRGDISWGDGTIDQAWFEDPVYVSSRTAEGVARLFAYHTYEEPGIYPVTITVSAINHSGVSGQTTIDAFIGQ